MNVARDIFDDLENEDASEQEIEQLIPEEGDSYVDEVKNEIENLNRKLSLYADDKKNQKQKMAADIKALIKSEVSKLTPIQNVIERTIEKQVVKNVQVPVHLEPRVIQAPPPPPQIIKEVRVEVEKPAPFDDTRIKALEKQITDLKKELEETRKIADNPIVIHGGPGVIGIPAPEPNPDNYVLTVEKGKAKWKVATGGSASTDVYTVSNVTTDRSFDADLTSIDELADVLGSLIASLQGAGIIQ